MLDALAAHGPDRSHLLSVQAVSFGHRLLKITPEDSFETQPLAAPSSANQPGPQAILLVADARIDNRAQLTRELDLPPSEIASLPDSALVLRAWQLWGQDCVHHLVGAFAFAVWDPNLQQLYLARDHAGARPLYYCKTAEFFAFSTTARAILACPGVSAELDQATLSRDVMGLPPEPCRTRFRDVQALMPGHCLVVSRDSPDAVPRRYWRFDALPPTRFSRDQDYVDAFLEIFDEAVRCCLRSTGEVVSHLSAGLDSGAVTAAAARLLGASGKRLTAYTSVPCANYAGTALPGRIANEGPFAAEVAALYPNIDHRLMDTTGSDMLRELARIFPIFDVPHAAPLNNVWWTLILDQAAAIGAKVLLTGALGNTTISYSGYDIIQASFRSGHWLKALREAIQLRRNGASSIRNAASQTIFSALPWAVRSRIDPSVRGDGLTYIAVRPDRARELHLVEQYRRHFYFTQTHLPVLMEKYFVTNQYGDCNTMTNAGWRIDARDPTADKRVFEFCASIPLEQYLVGDQASSLIRRAMRGRLPDSTVDRRERGQQAADWYESLSRIHSELAAELARLERSPGSRNLLDLDRLRSAVDHWPQSAEQAADQRPLYDGALIRAVSLGYFIRRWEESGSQ